MDGYEAQVILNDEYTKGGSDVYVWGDFNRRKCYDHFAGRFSTGRWVTQQISYYSRKNSNGPVSFVKFAGDAGIGGAEKGQGYRANTNRGVPALHPFFGNVLFQQYTTDQRKR